MSHGVKQKLKTHDIVGCGRIIPAKFVQRNGNVPKMTYVIYVVTILPLD